MNTKKEFKAEEMEERLEMSMLSWRNHSADEQDEYKGFETLRCTI